MTVLNSEAGLSVRKELSRTIKEGEGGKFCDASVIETQTQIGTLLS